MTSPNATSPSLSLFFIVFEEHSSRFHYIHLALTAQGIDDFLLTWPSLHALITLFFRWLGEAGSVRRTSHQFLHLRCAQHLPLKRRTETNVRTPYIIEAARSSVSK